MSKKSGWTKTPNAIYDAMPGMCEAELRVTLTVIRLTYGYQKERAEITYEDFTIHGGITSRTSISKGIKLMLRRGFFAKGEGQSEYIIPNKNSTLNGLSESEDSPLNELSDDPNSPDSVLPIYSKERKNNNNDYEPTPDEQFAMDFFQGAAGFPPPHESSSDYYDLWITPIRAIVKKSNGRTEIEDRIAHAVHQMQGGSGKTYTIKSPKSILTFALNWGNEPSSNSNGHHLNGNAAVHAFEVAWECAGRGRLDTEDEKTKKAARTFGFARLRQWNPEFKSTAQTEFIRLYNDIN